MDNMTYTDKSGKIFKFKKPTDFECSISDYINDHLLGYVKYGHGLKMCSWWEDGSCFINGDTRT